MREPAIQALEKFGESLGDIDRLLEIHSNEGGGGPGRKYRLEVLNKASIVLMTAFWEAFCEDIVGEAIEHLVEHAPDHAALPLTLRKVVADQVRENANELEPWQLAGDGWRSYLAHRLEALAKKRNFEWNSPKSGNVDDLFKSALGIPRISSAWKYAPSVTLKYCRDTLNEFVELRGNIAHRGQHTQSVKKSHALKYTKLLIRLAVATDLFVRDWLEEITGQPVP